MAASANIVTTTIEKILEKSYNFIRNLDFSMIDIKLRLAFSGELNHRIELFNDLNNHRIEMVLDQLIEYLTLRLM